MHQEDLLIIINLCANFSGALNHRCNIFHPLHLLQFSVLYIAYTFLYRQLINFEHNPNKYYRLQIVYRLIIYINVRIIKIQQMKTERRTVNTPDRTTNSLSSSRPGTSDLIDNQIKTKFNTFMNWDAKSYLRSRRIQRTNKKQQLKGGQNIQIFNALFKYANDMKKKQQRNKNRKNINVGRVSMSSKDHRQKFKKLQNPLQFIQYYIQNNKFQPNQEQQKLIDKLVQIRAILQSMQNINLDRVLEQIYKLMNMTVDFNELKLLILSIVLAADICMQAKDINRSFYFYHQAKIASLYSGLCEVTVQSLIGMAKIAHELGHISSSLKFLKKSLAYSWRINDTDSEIQIYDLMGQSYCQQGKMDKADYYHQRFAHNQTQQQKSVIKKIYLDIIKDDAKNRNLRLYNDDVDILILQTLNLPIYSFEIYPPFKSNVEKGNYINGQSPRKFIKKAKFTYSHFQPAQKQIQKVIEQLQFQKQMPNPDIQIPYVQNYRYGKTFERNTDFSRTLQFHQIIGAKMQPSPIKVNKKYSIEKEIELMMAQKPDPNWYQKMSKNVKQQRLQKLGSLKGAIHKSHLKIQRQKRSLSSQSQNIRKSVNKAILNWIDPIE